MKRAASLLISIPRPCEQSWQEMTPSGNGRHCAMCDKVVVDFSLLSDRQILNIAQSEDRELCGRFYTDQLDRELSSPVTLRFSGLSLAATVALAISLTSSAYGQEDTLQLPQSSLITGMQTGFFVMSPIAKSQDTDLQSPEKHTAASGRVIDIATGEGVNLAIVQLTNHGLPVATAFSDPEGNFSIALDELQDFDSLLVSGPAADGFEEKAMRVSRFNKTPVIVYLNSDNGKRTFVSGRWSAEYTEKGYNPYRKRVIRVK